MCDSRMYIFTHFYQPVSWRNEQIFLQCCGSLLYKWFHDQKLVALWERSSKTSWWWWWWWYGWFCRQKKSYLQSRCLTTRKILPALFSAIQRLLQKILKVCIVFKQAGFVKRLDPESERLHQTGILHILTWSRITWGFWRGCYWGRLKDERMEDGSPWKKRGEEEDKDFVLGTGW